MRPSSLGGCREVLKRARIWRRCGPPTRRSRSRRSWVPARLRRRRILLTRWQKRFAP